MTVQDNASLTSLAYRLTASLQRISPKLPLPTEAPAPIVSSRDLEWLTAALKPALSSYRSRGDCADIWAVAGLGHDEVRNTRILAWLLDPLGSHGMGDRYLFALWKMADPTGKLGFFPDHVERVTRENYPLGDAGNRVDIEIVGASFVLFIEVKIHAGETKPDQVRLYADLAARKAKSLHKDHWGILYLSENTIDDVDRCLCFRWRDVARAIRSNRAGPARNPGEHLALLFASHVSNFH